MSTPNPFLKQLLSEISSNATSGRLNDYSWGALNEAKKKKKSVKEANVAPKKDAPTEEAPPAEEPAAPEGEAAPTDSAPEADAGGLPPLGGEAPADAGAEAPAADAAPDSEASSEDAEGEADQAQDDATAAKAELEKAKAEKDQAEKDIKKHSYVQLGSSAGTHFLLGKIIDHAFKTNSIDALATEMVGKLKVQTPEDFSNFSEELSPYKGIPGVSELLSSMKGMATKQAEAPADSGEEQA
jgi:hypothetical protein